jgi:hypothetical protein
VNEITLAFIVFFGTIILLIQTRYFLKHIRLRKKEQIAGLQAHSGWEDFCECLGCCGAKAAAESTDDYVKETIIDPEYETRSKEIAIRKEAYAEYEIQQKVAKREKSEKTDIMPIDEIKTTINKALSDKKKTSVWWILDTLKIPKELLDDIIKQDPNYTIENNYVINLKLVEIKKKRKKQAPQRTTTKRVVTSGYCIFCGEYYETALGYCPLCGVEI